MALEKLTYCRPCEPMCGLRVEVEEGRVLRIRGDREHPISRGHICRRGVAFAEIHNDPDRLRQPHRRGAHGWDTIGWPMALEEVGDKLREIRDRHGPRSVAVYLGNPMAFCTYGAMSVPAFVRALGTDQFYTSGSQDCNNKFAAAERVFGSPVLQPVPDLDHVQYLLIIGANPAVSGMSFVQVGRPVEALRRIRERGGRVVVVDPRRSETARLADEHLAIQPDTDAFLLLSLLWVMIERDLYDRHWAEQDPRGFADLAEVVRNWPPERTEALTGIPAGKVEEMAARLAGPAPAACYGSVGINLGRSGTLTYWLMLAANLLSGHFDRKGGSIVCRGLVDAVRLYRVAGLDRSGRRSATGDFRPIMGTYPAALLAQEILNERKPRVRALVVAAGNPLLSVPNERRLKEALKKLDLLVCLDLYRNETGAYAHYILPTTDFLEREDLNLSHAGLQVRPFAAFTPAAVEPDGAQRPEWEILEDIAARMGLRLWGGAERAVRLLGRLPVVSGWVDRSPGSDRVAFPRFAVKTVLRTMGRVRLADLEASPRGVLLGDHEHGRLRGGRGWGRRGPRVRLAPPELVREAWKLDGFLTLRAAESGEFLLIGKRERHTHNTWMHNAAGLVGEETTNYLYMHPEDAAAKGIRQGDRVSVRNQEGARVEIPCRLTADLRRGVVAVPHGWGHVHDAGWRRARRSPGVNVNRLASDSVWKLEPIAGVAWMTGIPVDVKPLKKRRRKKDESTGG